MCVMSNLLCHAPIVNKGDAMQAGCSYMTCTLAAST